jgi:thymidine kinase
MAKLYFRYGTVGCGKTFVLLSVAHTYQIQGKSAFLIKPTCDTRFGASSIRSRSGVTREADLLVDPQSILPIQQMALHQCILVDEAQFLSVEMVNQLKRFSVLQNIPVICYGLRTDFRSQSFPGSQRLLEIADSLEEIKTTCMYCNHKAIFNLKIPIPTSALEWKSFFEGTAIDLGCEEKYHPVCSSCYLETHASVFPVPSIPSPSDVHDNPTPSH